MPLSDPPGEQLARSELRFRAIIDGFADPLLNVDGYQLVRYANAALARVLGHPPADVLARPFGALLHPDERPAVEAKLAAVLGSVGATAMLEHRIRRASGEWEIAETTANHMEDPTGRSLLVLHVRLVTERKRAEEALRRSEARLKEAQRIAHIASWELDLTRNQLEWSDEIFRILERAPAELGTSFEAVVETIHPDDQERVMAARAEALRDRRPCRVSHRLLSRTGRVRHVETQCELTFAEDGRPLEERGTVQDITERANMESQLAQRQKMETVGQLAGGIAHDFNNLLTVIQGTAELAAADLPAPDPRREAYEAILEAGARASSLTQQLLAFGRKQMLQPTVVSLATVVAKLQGMLRRLIGEHIHVVVHAAEGSDHVRVDPTQIDQIVLNLAINARDAMPHGGTLTIQTASVVLDETYARSHQGVQPGPHVMLAVSDTGCGMDEATRERMFEPFFTTKGPGKGSGLGLATVYGIVRQSGGDIWCYSEIGTGTTMKVYLPRVAPAPREEGSQPPSSTMRGSEKILVVDDDEGLRRVAKRILEKHGYSVLVAAGGEEALLVLAADEGAIDLVITDVVMPGMGGRELAERLHTLRPTMRVLFASGYTEDTIFHHGVLDEGAHFIVKPYTLQTLPRKVREVLDG